MATSAGILLYRMADPIEVLLVHPGGPFWARKDDGAWSIPKGEFAPDAESAWDAARREFEEELGVTVPVGQPLDLGVVTQKAGKVVHGFALEGDLDPSTITSNSFVIEWPPRSGRMAEYPEIDRAEWMDPARARVAINPAQVAFLDRLDDAQSR